MRRTRGDPATRPGHATRVATASAAVAARGRGCVGTDTDRGVEHVFNVPAEPR